MAIVKFSEKNFKILLENYLRKLNPGVDIEVVFYITNNYTGLHEICSKKCTIKVNIIKNINVNGYECKQKIEQELSEEDVKSIFRNILGEEVTNIKFDIGCDERYNSFYTIYNVSVNVNEQKLRLRM